VHWAGGKTFQNNRITIITYIKYIACVEMLPNSGDMVVVFVRAANLLGRGRR